MTIAFSCENCGKDFQTDASLAGKKCKCKQCGHVFLVPAARSAAPPSSSSKNLKTFGEQPAPAPRPKPASAPPPPRPAAAPPPRPATKPPSFLDEDDPYGLDNAYGSFSKPAAPADDDELPAPPRGPKPVSSTSRKKKSRRDTGCPNEGLPFFDGLPGLYYLISLAVLAVAFVWTLISPRTGGVVLVIATVLSAAVPLIYGSIGSLVVPFVESPLCGLMNMFLPIYPLYYLVTRWGAMRGAFLSSLAGVGYIVLAALLLPAVGAANQAARRANGGPVAQAGPGARGGFLPMPPPGADEGDEEAEPGANVNPAAEMQRAMRDMRNNMAGQAGGFGPPPGGEGPPAGFGPPPGAGGPPAGFGQPPGVNGPPAGFGPPPGFGGPPGVRGPRMGFGQPPGGNANPPAGAVVLLVSGMDDQETADVFGEKLSDALQANFPPGYSVRGTGAGGRWTYHITGISDARALADKIDWAKVESVNGLAIQVRMTPVRGAGVARANRPRVGAMPNVDLPGGPDTAAGGDFVSQVLADLGSPARNRRADALRKIGNAPPDDQRRAEVAKAVEPLLKDPDGFTRAEAVKALSVWGGPENTPALVAALKDPAFNVRWAVLDAIGALKDPAAAGPVAQFLEGNDRNKASEALKKMGPGAEDAVLPFLSHNDVFTRMETAKVLQVIGTQKSVTPLQTLIRRVNGFGLDAMAAREALQQISVNSPAPKKKSGLVPKSRR